MEASCNERDVVQNFQMFLKAPEQKGYLYGYEKSMSRFPKDQGLNDRLSPPIVDHIEGFHKKYVNCEDLLSDIEQFVTPIEGDDSIALAHFAGKSKGRGENVLKASRQLAYDAAY